MSRRQIAVYDPKQMMYCIVYTPLEIDLDCFVKI